MPTLTLQQLQAESTSAPLEHYAKAFPELLALSLKGFRSREHRAILIYLERNGSRSFNQIQKDLGLRSNLLAKKLNELGQAGLIANYITKKAGSNEYSWYRLSDLGGKLLKSILNTFNKYIEPINRH